MTRTAPRFLAGVLAIASAAPVVIAVYLALLTAVISAQQPDPTIPDGDPCCGHPDTWGDVALGFASAGACVLGAVAVTYVAVLLGRYAGSGSTPTDRQRRRAAGAVAWIGLVLALIVASS